MHASMDVHVLNVCIHQSSLRICIHLYMYAYMYSIKYVCIYACIYICMCACIRISSCTGRQSLSSSNVIPRSRTAIKQNKTISKASQLYGTVSLTNCALFSEICLPPSGYLDSPPGHFPGISPEFWSGIRVVITVMNPTLI